MRTRSTNILSIFFSLCLSVSTFASPDNPEKVVSKYFSVSKKADWKECAKLMHPEALATFKNIFTEILEVDTSNQVVLEFFGLNSPAEFSELSGSEVFEKLFAQFEITLPSFINLMKNMNYSIIGHLYETENLAHVVCRIEMNMMGVEMSKMEVMSLKKHEDKWRLLLSGNMQNIAQSLKQQLLR